MRSETSVIRDVILPEGTTLRLRAATRDDAAGLLAFVERLTPESRYFRFHGLPPVGPRLVEPFLDPDWDERGALVGTLASEAGRTDRGARNLVAPPRPHGRRGSVCGRRRVPGPRDRHTSRRAACGPGRRGGNRALRRGGSLRQSEHAPRFRARRIRGHPRARRRSRRGRLPDRADGVLPGDRRLAGPSRRRRIARPVLLASWSRGLRRLSDGPGRSAALSSATSSRAASPARRTP